jgi:hypothetical protein
MTNFFKDLSQLLKNAKNIPGVEGGRWNINY